MIATLTRSRLVLRWLHLAPVFLAVEAAMMMHRVQSRQLLRAAFGQRRRRQSYNSPAGDSSTVSLR